MTELDKLKLIESAFDKALKQVWYARKIIRTIESDYNTIYPEGLDKFVSQLTNYYAEYTRKVNTAIREKIDNEKPCEKGKECPYCLTFEDYPDMYCTYPIRIENVTDETSMEDVRDVDKEDCVLVKKGGQ